MEIEIIYPDESTEITRKYIEINSTRESAKDILVSECDFRQRGSFLLVMYRGRICLYENAHPPCYLRDAIKCMNPWIPAKWKTLERLKTLRQAIRENYTQGMELEKYLVENIDLQALTEFFNEARKRDKIYHGQLTF